MTGYCSDCGNQQCVCALVDNQRRLIVRDLRTEVLLQVVCFLSGLAVGWGLWG